MIRGHRFSQRIISDWPFKIISAPKVLNFKTKLDLFLYNSRFDFISCNPALRLVLFDICVSCTNYLIIIKIMKGYHKYVENVRLKYCNRTVTFIMHSLKYKSVKRQFRYNKITRVKSPNRQFN